MRIMYGIGMLAYGVSIGVQVIRDHLASRQRQRAIIDAYEARTAAIIAKAAEMAATRARDDDA